MKKLKKERNPILNEEGIPYMSKEELLRLKRLTRKTVEKEFSHERPEWDHLASIPKLPYPTRRRKHTTKM